MSDDAIPAEEHIARRRAIYRELTGKESTTIETSTAFDLATIVRAGVCPHVSRQRGLCVKCRGAIADALTSLALDRDGCTELMHREIQNWSRLTELLREENKSSS